MASPQQAVSHEEISPEIDPFDFYAKEILEKLESLELPYEDGIPMETNWHRLQMNLLIEIVEQHWKDRTDFFAGGNMFVYFSTQQVKNQDYRGPDFFVVKDTDGRKDRKSWIVWEEGGRYPDVIIELASPSTIKTDLEFKRKLYERVFNTREYFCYDPETKTLYGWHKDNSRYKPIPVDENGRMECRELGLWIGLWEGKHLGLNASWLRFFTENGELVLKFDEAERKRADREGKRANEQQERAEAAEKELERLRALLSEKRVE